MYPAPFVEDAMPLTVLDPDRWRIVSPYLDRALELPEDERTTWLRSLRSEDPTLADEVAALLDDRRAASREGFLDGRAAGAPSRVGRGDAVGAYTLESWIGQGGMGTVWRARRSDGRFEGQAAVKLLNAGRMGREGTERLAREGSVLARLRHPHIAHLADAGVSEAGQPYLVLEHVDGERIDAYCDREALSVEARARLFMDVLAAVAHAHSKLVVHRDIKPSNVLVTREGQVKLLDFGIAKILEGEGPALTREGAGALTPQYAAPEQVTGGEITTATDVYALGLLLYELLAGRHPAEDALTSPAQLLRAITETDPPRLSEAVAALPGEAARHVASRRGATPDRLRRQLAGDLDTIVGKALEKNPQDRYASAAAMADDLRRHLGHEPIEARRGGVGYRAAKFARRHRTPVALAAAALVALCAGLLGTAWQAREAARQRDIALAQLERAEGINEFTGYLLGEAVPGGQAVTMLELLRRAERMIERRYARDEALGVELLVNVADVYEVLEDTANAERTMRRAYEASQRVLDPVVRAGAACGWARVQALLARPAEAERHFDEGLGYVTPDARFDKIAAGCLIDRAYVASVSGHTAATVANAEAAIARLARRPGAFAETRSNALHVAALGLDMQGETARADRAFAAAMQELERMGHVETSAAAVLLNNWALTRASSDVLGALRLQERAIAILEAEDGGGGVSPGFLSNQGRLLLRLERPADAASAYARARRTAQAHDNLRNVGSAGLGLARAERRLGRLDEAASTLEEAGRALRATLPAGHHLLADLVREEGLLAAARGDRETGLARLAEAVRLHEAATERHVGHVETLLDLAALEIGAARVAEASAHLTAAFDLAEALRGGAPHSAWVGLGLAQRARLESARGDAPAARRALEEAIGHMVPTLGEDHPAVKDVRVRLSASS
jgi:serine/threonine-protein kinase